MTRLEQQVPLMSIVNGTLHSIAWNTAFSIIGRMDHPIKTKRLQAGLTQSELADLASVTSKSIYFYEKNGRNPSAPTRKKLAAALGCQEFELLITNEDVGTTTDIDPLESLPEDERKLLENYRGMAERDRSIYRNMADTFVTDRDKPKPKKRKAE